MNFLKLFELLRNLSPTLISDIVALVGKVQESVGDGDLTADEISAILAELDRLADNSKTELDDEVIQFVKRLVDDPFIRKHLLKRVGLEAVSECCGGKEDCDVKDCPEGDCDKACHEDE